MWPRSPVNILIAATAIVLAALYVTYRLVDPLPPRHLAIAAGMMGSGYDNFAKQYARILARQGVELEIRNAAGAVEDLDLLRDPASGVQAALTTFGFTQPADIRCGDSDFLQERGAYYAFCTTPWQAHFPRHHGNRPSITYVRGSKSH